MLENELRDLLAGQLHILQRGLKLEAIEKHIPNKLGTKGFIDLLATDPKGRWVLIEIKRSDSAAREAIHEVLKYVEGVKGHLGVRDDEIRVMIVSTEWDELLVPFSRFIEDTSISVSGFKLDVQAKKLSAKAIDPLPVSMGRILSSWHEVNYFASKERLEKSIKEYDRSCKKKRIPDYVMVILEAPNGHHEKVLENTREVLSQQHMRFRGEVDPVEITRILGNMKRYEYVNYFVPQLLRKLDYLAILKIHDQVDDELTTLLADMGDEEALCHLQELVLCLSPRPKYDYYEIGYAAKFRSRLLESEGWRVVEIIRRGSLERNLQLTDQVILNEISGDTGITGQRYKRKLDLENKAQLLSAKREIAECLEGNPIWRSNILNQIDEVLRDFPKASVEISIYNPGAGVFTLFFTATQQNGVLFQPQYSIAVENGHLVRAYWGELTTDGKPSSFNKLISKYYDGDVGQMLFEAGQGFRCSRDAEILEDLGLVYCSYRKDFRSEGNESFYFANGRWKAIEDFIPFQKVNAYFDNNAELIKHIAIKIGRRQLGGMFDGSSTDRQLDELVDLKLAKKHSIYSVNPPTKCELCDLSIVEDRYFVFGAIEGNSVWANICADCFYDNEMKIGGGMGQLYRRERNGRWLLVAGFPP